MIRNCVRISSALLFLFVVGCGAGKGDMSGTVKYKGKTVHIGIVTVLGSDNVPVVGHIDENGTYSVKGVTAGNVRIGVISPEPPKSGSPVTESRNNRRSGAVSPELAKKWFQVPDNFSDPEKSGLIATIKSGPNSHDINME